MFTPQQIEEISFKRATFGGYDMQSVDEFLEPLTTDYVTLYKENALLKSKMRVLVGKLEEYRKNEASIQQAVAESQQACEAMIREAEDKCAKMLAKASQSAAETARAASTVIEEEQAKVEAARRVTAEKISAMQAQIRGCIDALEQIKNANAPTPMNDRPEMFDVEAEEAKTQVVADEISQNLETLVGTTEEDAPKADPKHPVADASTTTKFANLQFGRNYDPEHK